jgi:hypothetical protein
MGLYHEVFFTEVVPSFEHKAKNKIILQVNIEDKNGKKRINRGTINIKTLAVEDLKLVAPLVDKTINNENIKIAAIEGDLKSFQKKHRNVLTEDNARLYSQYQQSLFHKKLKVDFLVEILEKIGNIISSRNNENGQIASILEK